MPVEVGSLSGNYATRRMALESRDPYCSSLATLAGLSPTVSSLRAVSSFSGVTDGLRPPPLFPFARAAARPAIVHVAFCA